MPKMIHEEILCGFKRCCPTIQLFDDGSVELSDNDIENGSLGTIKIDAEAAKRLLELLSKK